MHHPPPRPPDPPAEPLPAAPARRRGRWGLGLVPPLWLVWLAMDGAAHAALGLAAAAVAAAVGAALVPGHPYRWRPAKLAAFALYFVQQSLRGGIDVASRALHPRMPVDPCWVEHRLTLPPGQPRTLMLSVVTLLPGSLGADFDAARNVLHVHLLARGGDDRLAELERRIAGLFGLESRRAR